MNFKTQKLTDHFLRTFLDRFTVRDLYRFFSKIGVKASLRECTDYLESCPWVFPLENGTYITKAGAFTDELFSIRPTPQEYDQGLFVPGSRCMPFVDGEMLSSALQFYVDNELLPRKVGVFDSDKAIDFFILYGEEYAPQYIASDPANAAMDMVSRDFELPNKISLSGIDLTPLIEKYGFRKGDRLVCKVRDWNMGIIDVVVMKDGDNQFDRGLEGCARLDWYDNLECALLESFDRMGPCGTMEEQIANVFFENMSVLCGPSCGSVEEYINRYADRVGIEHFGVETRFWFKGQNVPAVGKWNVNLVDSVVGGIGLGFLITPEIIDQYILDMNYLREKDLKKLVENIYPADYVFHKDEKSCIMMELRERDELISQSYNWFADQTKGLVRNQALELFSRVNSLVYRIDVSAGNSIKDFPQQELVILTQLFGHLYKILQSLEDDPTIEDDSDAVLLSLDGMKWNFEDIRGVLEAAVEEHLCNRFKVF